MDRYLAEILRAHGGGDRYARFREVRATIVTGGELWALKGVPQDPAPRSMTVWLHEERASLRPYGAPDQRTDFTPGRVAIEKADGTVVAERGDPRSHFAGHTMTTPWDALDRAYFNGYALWTYLTTPFLLAGPGVTVSGIGAWREGDETWRGLRATFPEDVATHSRQQDFYFDEALRLRRYDYHVEIAGGFACAQYVHDYVEAQGLRMPSKRRVHLRAEDGSPRRDTLLVSIDVSDVHYA